MKHFLLITFLALPILASAQMISAPDRKTGEGEGPFDRLIIRGVTLIDGTGGPPTGPVDVVVEKNKIVDIKTVGVPHIPIDPEKRPKLGNGKTKEIDA
ncbi:MAG: amidohydrolase, partial [Cyclobacteriaceae bacterium]